MSNCFEDAPAATPAVDVLIPFADLEAKVIALARAVPEARYDKRFGQIFAHIVNLNQSLLEGAMKDQPALTAFSPDKELKGKEETVAALTASFAAVKKELESARNGFLGSDAEFLGKPNTRRGLFTALDAAVAEQLGQALEYARAAGIAGHGIFATE